MKNCSFLPQNWFILDINTLLIVKIHSICIKLVIFLHISTKKGTWDNGKSSSSMICAFFVYFSQKYPILTFYGTNSPKMKIFDFFLRIRSSSNILKGISLYSPNFEKKVSTAHPYLNRRVYPSFWP